MYKWWSALLLGSLAWASEQDRDHAHLQENANRIFNAVHSSMRQWGSSLDHNGMSLFIATVPKGVELYHGTGMAVRINGTEWLAFEPEHALIFARPRREPPGKGGPPGPPGPPGKGDQLGGPFKPEKELFDGEEWHHPEKAGDRSKFWDFHHDGPRMDIKKRHYPHEDQRHDDRPLTHTAGQRERARMPQQEPIFNHQEPEHQPQKDGTGYLHTYTPKHDLRLLYLDGQSAAKSTLGTLDMQDIVLLHDSPPPGPIDEKFRADKLCEMAEKEWDGRIDGFLRMELGFEIILCSFERHLKVKRITVALDSGLRGPPGNDFDGGSIDYYRAVASRFDGIGGDRVRVNYDEFVSLYATHDAVYFDENGLPRVRNRTDVLQPFFTATKAMISHDDAKKPINWQSTADMVVARYSDRIEYLASGDLKSLKAFQAEVHRALLPFVDYIDRNRTKEIQRCALQFLQEIPPSSNLAATAILNVSATICASFSSAAASNDYREAMAYIRNLKSWLAWPSWKRCRGCGYDEVCFVPIWPFGGKEEYDEPRCISNMSQTSRGYWGDLRGPGEPHGKEHLHD